MHDHKTSFTAAVDTRKAYARCGTNLGRHIAVTGVEAVAANGSVLWLYCLYAYVGCQQ